ncbi:MAG TPA: hypothetical protein PKM43_13270 [Verrucomicrobiota bacterium]|nr:hypothetical protein [Verrucomicrobiota bacterium]HRZ35370.1 hypothetical protein [Candidatus Paceibacterota bacterium]HRZ57469.1 hypothetical protein [Candidatus Paceibacterota bacterium]
MKTVASTQGSERGSAVIVVLALLLLILAFMAGNDVTLRSLRREMQIIEERQLRKYEPPEPGSSQTGPGRESPDSSSWRDHVASGPPP